MIKRFNNNMLQQDLKIFDEKDLFKIKATSSYSKDELRLFLKAIKYNIKKMQHRKNKINSLNSMNQYLKSNGHSYNNLSKGDRQQLCTVKFRFGNNKKGHKKFVEYYMPQIEKNTGLEKSDFFGDDLEEYKKHLVSRHFKIIISPENQDVDLETVTNILINKMNKLMDAKLRWIAIEHNDTNHKHVHVVINGIDKNGKKIDRINKDFIKFGARAIVREACTKLVGERTLEDIKSFNSGEYKRNRFTQLDKKILKTLNLNNQAFSNEIIPYDPMIKKRLDYLIELGIAKKLSSRKYKLETGWDDTLKSIGRFNTFTEVRKEFSYLNKPIEVYQENGIIKNAKILKIYNMDDEKIWNNATVVETQNKIYYIPLFKKMNRVYLNKIVEIQSNSKVEGLHLHNITIKER